jgi:hypothetical protein
MFDPRLVGLFIEQVVGDPRDTVALDSDAATRPLNDDVLGALGGGGEGTNTLSTAILHPNGRKNGREDL